ncbi:MAG: hydantoinase/oxoprolinase family protein [Alphaproteobacteria bacterium]|nr:hydantoinase/oxoprolinase family protein [Alphaproteobacteria bacterium]
MTYRMGVDIGGTFTDFALIDDTTGELTIHKQLTTPADPSEAVLDGVATLLKRRAVAPAQLGAVIHGSTLVTNAIIERKGAVTGMLVTKGFRDVLDIAMERRYDLYDLTIRFPTPIVARRRRRQIDERLDFSGAVLQPLDAGEVERAAAELVEQEGVRALAICFLHSFVNAGHEEQAREIVARRYPELYVSTSADVFPYAREYERWNTTAMNAFVQPVADRYLGNLEGGLQRLGVKGPLYIMTSSGGTVTTATAKRYPVRMLESGPAAGVLMSAHHGRTLGLSNILSYDMGGTTAKGAIVRGGQPHKTYEIEVARIHHFKEGSGLPAKVPVLDMIEIGSGGGSIAELDDRGVIRVGPQSAGADPGPACYGRGGKRPTLTDADLLLGYLDPDFFLGGKMKLDRAAAETALELGLAKALGVDVTRAAWGIHEVINEDVARAFRVHASEKGFDYRGCSMIAFGGSGPMHALRIARKLRIPRVVLPTGAGVMSAFGMLVSPLSFQIARSNRVGYAELPRERFAELFAGLTREAAAFLLRAGVPQPEIRVTRRLDMRYRGQGYEIEVELPDELDLSAAFERLPQLFGESYARIFSLSYLQEPLEIVNWKVEVQGPTPAMSQHFHLALEHQVGAPEKGRRQAYFPEAGGYVATPVYDRYALRPEVTIGGPALIEENESTCVVGVGDQVTVDAAGNLVTEIAQEQVREAAA